MTRSEAGRFDTRNTTSGAHVHRAAISGDRGACNSDLSGLWCRGRQHVTYMLVCARVPQTCRRTTPVDGPRNLPLLAKSFARHQLESGALFTARRGEASETRRHRISDTKAYPSTSPTRAPKRQFTYFPEALIHIDQPHLLQRYEMATVVSTLDLWPSPSASINLSPLR